METCELELTHALEKELYQIFVSKLDSKYNLVCTDYRDSLEGYPNLIQDCIDNKSADSLGDLSFDLFDDVSSNSTYEIIKDISEEIGGSYMYEKYWGVLGEFALSDSVRDLADIIRERDNSNPIKECLSRTEMRCRIELYSNNESLASNWDIGNTYVYNGYFKEMADLLCLNPAKIKKEFLKSGIKVAGKWPNYTFRDGNEVVKYEDLAQEMANQTSYCRLTFMAMLPLMSLYKHNFDTPDYIIIPKGNDCGMFSSWVGGGSMLEMTLQRDLRIPYKRMREKNKYDYVNILVDERKSGYGYCIDEVYGLTRECWGKELVLEYNEK